MRGEQKGSSFSIPPCLKTIVEDKRQTVNIFLKARLHLQRDVSDPFLTY